MGAQEYINAMATLDIIDSSKLSGPAIGELRDLIAHAFSEDDLVQLTSTEMEWDFDAIVSKGSKQKKVFDLLTHANKMGLAPDLLRAILSVRGKREDLRDAIRRHCPQALDAPPATQAQAVVTGVKSLESQIRRPAVHDVIVTSREKLEQLSKDIDVLYNYKVLHDCLHTIHLMQYPTIVNDVKQFRTDQIASMELETNIIALKGSCSDARNAAESLPDEAAVRAEEMQWVTELESAVIELSEAFDHGDDHGAARAVRSVKSVIRDESLRINRRLAIVAEQLPLDELTQIIERVVRIGAVGSTDALKLQNAIHSLQSIQPELRERVAEHRQWQRIEKDFWYAEECIERGISDSIEEFSESWSAIKSQVDSLARAAPAADWAKTTKKRAALIDKDLSTQVDSAMTNFKYFRETALYHFFQVNKALKAQCAEILKIRAPLRSLLDKV
jgi:hypothetical protein